MTLSTLPAGFQETLIGTNVNPGGFDFAPDGRMFIANKDGRVTIIKADGTTAPQPFFTVPVDTYRDRGLTAVVVDPNYALNHYVYVYYTAAVAVNPNTANNGAMNRLVRLTASNANADLADPTSATVLLDGILSQAGIHQGGLLRFGADGKLYLGVGEADISQNAQDLSNLYGKVLRLDVHNYPNMIPADNPFAGQVGVRPEIWAYGFRNPFSGGVRPGTSDVFVNDVGNTTWEEVNRLAKGGNYGWPLAEGTSNNSNFVNPLFTYNHNGAGAAIVGGTFYNGSSFPPNYSGQYFVGDLVQGVIRVVNPDTGAASTWATNVAWPTDIEMGPDGNLYWSSISSGSAAIYKISYVGSANRAPLAVPAADVTSGLAPLTVNFNASASSDPDGDSLSYSWDFGDGTTASGVAVQHTYTVNGTYNAVLTVSDRPTGGLTNSSMPIVIAVGNHAPQPTITTPLSTDTYIAGQTISFTGTGTDFEDGNLPASAFHWSFLFGHNTHFHDFLAPIDGATSGSFVIPTTGETDPDQYYRILLTVIDSQGLSTTTHVDIRPMLSTITLASNIAGVQLSLDGQPKSTPATITGVVGMQRVLSAPTQAISNQTFVFASWSDGGAATHTIVTPATATAYTATYQQAQLPYSALYSTTAPSTWSPGQTQTFTTTLTNTGTQTWNASDPNAIHLGVYFNGNSDAIYDWPSEPIRFSLPQDVAPGASVTITVTVSAPTAPGNYVLRQRLVKENVQWFDQFQATPISVGSVASLAASYATTAPTTWQPGQTLTFNTTVTNTGTLTWNAADPQAVHLGVYFNGNSDAASDWPAEPVRFLLPNDVSAGSSATITVTITAPSAPGTYVLRQRLVKENVAWFDQLQKTNVVVGSTAPTVTAVTPAGGAVGVATTTSVTATFSTAIDPTTLTASTFVLVRQGTTTPIVAVVSYDSTTNKATLQPSASLLAGATYTATLRGGPTGIKDLAGNPLAADQSWSFTIAGTLVNASQFISQSVPATMKLGQLYTISITMKNTGTKTWDPATHRLGSANPRDNLTWGLNRAYLAAPVAPGAQVTFRFSVRAPRTIGTYNFQWQMVEEHVAWFGALTTNLRIKVAR